MTTPSVVTQPIVAPDGKSAAAPDDQMQQVREAAMALLVQLPERETTYLLRLLQDPRVASPPSPYQDIQEAYSEYASNIFSSWQRVGDYLRTAIHAIEGKEARAERG